MESSGLIHSVGQYVAYFSIPRKERDGMLWKWYTAPGRRSISTRPKNAEISCAYLSILPKDETYLSQLTKKSVEEQKAGLIPLFEDAGWQMPRLLSAMQDAQDFYLQHIAQVKLPTWHWGRCAVVGDAAYCPSGLTGIGTSLAILGAYVLAGEIAKCKDDPTAALQAYDQKLRSYVEKKQKLYPGVPGIAHPSCAWGVSALNWVIWLVSWSGIANWLGNLSLREKEEFVLPVYQFE